MTLFFVVVAGASTFIYYYYSINVSSVNGTTISMVLANRVFLGGSFPNRNVTFFIEEIVHSDGPLDIRLIKPNFSANAVGITALGNLTFPDNTIKAGYYQTYNLRFSVNETSSTAKFGGSNGIDVTMTALVSAPLYERPIHKVDQTLWNWTTVTKVWEYFCC